MVSGHRQRDKLPSGGCPVYVNVYIYTRDVTCRNLLLRSSLIKDDCRGNYHKGKERARASSFLYCWSLIAWNNGVRGCLAFAQARTSFHKWLRESTHRGEPCRKRSTCPSILKNSVDTVLVCGMRQKCHTLQQMGQK